MAMKGGVSKVLMELVLFPIKFLLIGLDLLITLLTLGWVGAVTQLFQTKKPLRSVPVPGGEGEHHRVDVRYRDGLATSPRPGKIATLYDLIQDANQRYGDRPCMGTRQFLGYRDPDQRKVKHFGDDISWITFAEMHEIAHRFGAALRKAGCQPSPPQTNLDKITIPCRMAIFENTCAPWMLACMGAFSQSVAVVTVYATLGMDAVMEAVVDNIVPVIVCNQKSVPKLVQNASKMPSLKYIVYTNDLVGPEEAMEINTTKTAEANVTVMSFDDFCAMGDTKAFPPTPPVPETCAVVMYTSGSTGKPKGVIIKHCNIVATCAAVNIGLGFREGQERYLAYLPLAHILEMVAEFAVICMGGCLCFADPKSLSPPGAYPTGAMEAYQPTLMVGVPKVWETIKKGVQVKLAHGSPIARFLVETAVQWRTFCVTHGFDAPLFNALVFHKFKSALGGQLRMALSGGGPMNADVQQFMRVAFGIILVQGYGLTETCAGGTIQAVDDWNTGIAGVPIPSVEIKLLSVKDITDPAGQAYQCTDRHDVNGNPVFGRGEVCIRGGSVAVGYYMEADKTKESLHDDGWFHTGDVGQFTSDGSLCIVDRVKNLVKLKGGEYIAMEKMEMTYGNSSFVNTGHGGVCCYGDGDMDRPVALIQLNEDAAKKWAQEHNMSSSDLEKLKTNSEFYEAVMEDLKKEHAASGLSHLEKLAAVVLVTEPWTPDNGCLTAANKLQRRTIIDSHKEEFEQVKQKGVFS